MNRTLELTDAELQELDFLVKKECRGSEVELHHTRAFAYKDALKERIQLLEKLAAKLASIKPSGTEFLPVESPYSSPDGVRHHPVNPVNRG